MRIEYKTTLWKRIDIDDEHRYGLLKYLKDNPKASAADIYFWCRDNNCDPCVEDCEGSEYDMTPEDNGGHATIEISDTMRGDEVLFINGKP